MKNLFPEYYKKNKSDIKTIWDNGIFVFDTNVLLNLYRYSDSTKKSIIKLMEDLKEQIYLPHQVALEYNRNRFETIAYQEKVYKDFASNLSKIKESVKSSNTPPFFSPKIETDFIKSIEIIEGEIAKCIRDINLHMEDKDVIYDTLSSLFDGHITESFSDEELQKIYDEGEIRYKDGVPPGFNDATKGSVRKYGDLVLWKQLIKLAKDLQKDVILITEEEKDDWFSKLKNGKIIGPRSELISEIKKEADVNLHIMNTNSFLYFGKSFMKLVVDSKAFVEIDSIKKVEKEIEQENEKTKFDELKAVIDSIKIDIRNETDKLNSLDYQINNIKVRIIQIEDRITLAESDKQDAQQYYYQLQSLRNQLDSLLEQKAKAEYKKNMLGHSLRMHYKELELIEKRRPLFQFSIVE